MQLAFNNRRRFSNLVCVLLLLIPKGTSQFKPVFKIHFFFTFSQKHVSSTPPKCLLSNPLLSSSSNTEHGIPNWFMHIKEVYFVLSKQEEHIYLAASPTILFQKIKASCVRMTKIGNV